MTIKPGQVLSLNMRVNNSGTILQRHPYLILFADEELGYIEVAQVDSLAGKEFKAARKSNKIILSDEPVETVIDVDSFIQLDNSLRIEYFDDLVRFRRQEDILSESKLRDSIDAYIEYQNTHLIEENKTVYISKDELLSLNADRM